MQIMLTRPRLPDIARPGDADAATAILRALTADRIEPLPCCRADGAGPVLRD